MRQMTEGLPGGLPIVSVVMPAHNAGRYIVSAVESVLRQGIRSIELIVVDDMSTDNTVELIRLCAQRDPRVRIIRNESNVGAAASRNRGIETAEGAWIAFIDSDDIWREDKLELQLLRAEETGTELVYSSYRIIEDGRTCPRTYTVPERADYELMLRENVIGCSTAMVSRRMLGGRLFPEDVYHEDYALWLELLRGGAEAAGCIEPLVDWRVVSGSRSFDKRRAAKNRWMIYRARERLPLMKTVRVFAEYAVNGIRKHRRI